MILCVDSGNTRLKWGIHDGSAWLEQGALPQSEVAQLSSISPHWPQFRQAIIANVAGEAVASAIRAALRGMSLSPCFVRSESQRAGVSNHYENPEQLGVDRWCALISARQQTRAPVIVVGAGTATTIDSLDEKGNFLGGLILPGFDLMRSALAKNTANLPFAEGHWQINPRTTADAIFSGCLAAQLGAIERAYDRIAAHPDAGCLLFGGCAGLLESHLRCPKRVVPNLVLEGLLVLSVEIR